MPVRPPVPRSWHQREVGIAQRRGPSETFRGAPPVDPTSLESTPTPGMSSKNHPSCLTRRGSHSGIGHPVATNFNFNRASNKLEDPRVPGGQVSLRRQTEGATRGPCSRAVGGEERQVTGKHGHRGASHSAEPSRSAHAQHHALAAREISARFGRRVHVPPPA